MDNFHSTVGWGNAINWLSRVTEWRYSHAVREIFGNEPQVLTANKVRYLVGFTDAVALRNSVAKARQARDRRLREEGILPLEPDDGRLARRLGGIDL